MGEFLALCCAFTAGLSYIFVSKASDELDKKGRDIGVLMALYVNLILATVVFTGYLLLIGPIPVNMKGIGYYILVGLFSSFLGRFFVYEAINYIGASRASATKLIAPIVTLFISVSLLGEKISFIVLVGLAAVLGGLFWIMRESMARERLRPVCATDREEVLIAPDGHFKKKMLKSGLIKGFALALMSGVTFGVGAVFKKLGMMAIPSVIFGSWMAFLAAFLFFFPWVCWRSGWKKTIAGLKGSANRNYVYVGIITCIGQYFLLGAFGRTGVGVAYTLSNTESLFAVLLSYVFLKNKDRPNLNTIMGIVVAVTGTALILLGK